MAEGQAGYAIVLASESDNAIMQRLTRRQFIATGTAAGAALATMRLPVLAKNDLPTVDVGSMSNTEQLVLAQLLRMLLEDAGYETETHDLTSTFILHEARNAGDINVHVEYTGSGLMVLEQDVADFKDESISSAEVVELVYEEVKRGYKEKWNATWLDPLGFNNTYALGMRDAHADELGIESISDLIEHAGGLDLGAQHEFIVRDDGLPGLEDLYGIEFQNSQSMESGLMYAALDSENVDVISAYSTDGRIPAMNIRLLEDDLGFFPPYYAAPVVRDDLLQEDPDLETVLNQLAGRIDDATMAELNYTVDDGGEEPRDVARAFLVEEGLISGDD